MSMFDRLGQSAQQQPQGKSREEALREIKADPVGVLRQHGLNVPAGITDPMQMIQQLKANPIQFLQRAGFNVPNNLNDPNAIIQHLMNSGQISQQRYEQARQMAAQFKR